MPTEEVEQHPPQLVTGMPEETPSSGRHAEASGVRPNDIARAAQVSPSEPVMPTLPAKPRLELSDLRVPEVLVGSRRLRPMEILDGALSVPGPSIQDPPRLRVTPVEVDGPTLHIKGLNCFLRREGGRPSSGIDVRHDTVVELVTTSFEIAARIRVRLATREGNQYIFELDEAVLVVPGHLARWVVVLEVGAGRDAHLLYQS